jgi:hypothetical protein
VHACCLRDGHGRRGGSHQAAWATSAEFRAQFVLGFGHLANHNVGEYQRQQYPARHADRVGELQDGTDVEHAIPLSALVIAERRRIPADDRGEVPLRQAARRPHDRRDRRQVHPGQGLA